MNTYVFQNIVDAAIGKMLKASCWPNSSLSWCWIALVILACLNLYFIIIGHYTLLH